MYEVICSLINSHYIAFKSIKYQQTTDFCSHTFTTNTVKLVFDQLIQILIPNTIDFPTGICFWCGAVVRPKQYKSM